MNQVKEFNPTDRYVYDFKLCTPAKGWAQVDTSEDASYYGNWANPSKLQTLEYCEGDVYLNTYETAPAFRAAILEAKQWHEENGHRFYGIDPAFNEELKQAFVDVGLGELLH